MQMIEQFHVCKLRNTQNNTTYFQGQIHVLKGRLEGHTLYNT